jgi:hypothetical protein
MKFALERELKTLFTSSANDDKWDDVKWRVRAASILVGANYDFSLCFEAALPTMNCYSLSVDVSWPGQDPSHADYYQRTSVSWFELWTREFQTTAPPLMREGDAQRYCQLFEEACSAEQQVDSIPSIQQAIIAKMKQGARYRTSHKEGGSHVYWRGDRFVRSDYGENQEERQFLTEDSFLSMLFPFFRSDLVNLPVEAPLSEIDAWRLILRRLDS